MLFSRVRYLISLSSILVLVFTGLVHNYYGSAFGLNQTSINFGKNNTDDINILLVGMDARTDSYNNSLNKSELKAINAGDDDGSNDTDSMAVLHIPKNYNLATVISIPRDSYVMYPSGDYGKINGVYGITKEEILEENVRKNVPYKHANELASENARQALVDTVNNFLGIKVNHFVALSLFGLVSLIDQIRGVDVCLNHNVYEPLSNAKFHKGKQSLNGAQALSFVRQRHGLPNGDLDRIRRGHYLMHSLYNKLSGSNIMSNPYKLQSIYKSINKFIVVDSCLNVVDFAAELIKIPKNNIHFVTIPIEQEDAWTPDGKQSIVLVDKYKVQNFVKSLDVQKHKKSMHIYPKPSNYTINVLNSTRIDGLAAEVASRLKNAGFNIGEVANYNGINQELTKLETNNKDNKLSNYIKENIPSISVSEENNLSMGTLDLILGNDFNNIKLKLLEIFYTPYTVTNGSKYKEKPLENCIE